MHNSHCYFFLFNTLVYVEVKSIISDYDSLLLLCVLYNQNLNMAAIND